MLKGRKPHDEFFKVAFKRMDVVKDYIRSFLPPQLVEKLVLDQLKRQPVSYVNEKLKKFFSDLVYECPYGERGERVMITILYEHKSRPRSYPHLQLLCYQLEIWENQLEAKQPLSVIVPILFYHGREKWAYQPMESYFENLDTVLMPYVPTFLYHFNNIQTLPDREMLLMQVGILRNLLFLFKHIWDERYFHNQLPDYFRKSSAGLKCPGKPELNPGNICIFII